jgi:hypothetical protein
MFNSIRHFVALHKDLFIKLFLVDLLFSLITQFFIFGRTDYFDYLGNGVYFGIFFFTILSIYISIIKTFSAGASFYLMLPFRRGLIIPLLLGIQVIPFLCITLCETFLLSLAISVVHVEEVMKNIMHCIIFFTMIKVATIPVLIYSSKHLLFVFFYFLTFIPIWILTTLFDEWFFMHYKLRFIYVSLMFLFLAYCINWLVISYARK